MSEDRVEQGKEQEQGEKERPPRKLRLPKRLMAFLGILLSECAAAAGLLLLFACIAFRLRLSTEVIRAGLTALYLLPCLLGGCLVRWGKLSPALLWGIGVGAAFYGVLLVMSVLLQAGAAIGGGIPVLCLAGGAAPVLLKGKKPAV
ncbi:MAG: TIGR04086 family membrane protein [Blautia sp.]|nr:TIGR04086 family membrane protein [Blautia sp.]